MRFSGEKNSHAASGSLRLLVSPLMAYWVLPGQATLARMNAISNIFGFHQGSGDLDSPPTCYGPPSND
jgi:hypothetical protein